MVRFPPLCYGNTREFLSMKDDVTTRRLYYRAREVAELTGLALRTIRERLYADEIPSRKVGGARLIPAAWLHAGSDEEADLIAEEHRRKYRYTIGNGPFAHEGPLRAMASRFFHCNVARAFVG
jgi:excisionase family DNA binding protein